ncbi:predicted protein [Aspergillus nidulans FGSC A4]|uniref:Uncharacterized protein n=1 Tax=Emericella nidulans (strain FGSC A4 / ATCC 38163 / CBS 112.46 / NRRL 194 / M139) TaxID=227321 RepID=Q5B803_EMENI|nr:hypothetical protein [Aspergillus nidulans FGSC A4]EAA63295.1 predicted protein [Aspergillus nidulans FGSC A4]CBF82938.1 TPA: conserved hypothetical protein [Aspergillus nidulans FGSC A4]|eukprot:XP_660931.1 predicted protein [Aspergillus nidulans FGSC A4]
MSALKNNEGFEKRQSAGIEGPNGYPVPNSVSLLNPYICLKQSELRRIQRSRLSAGRPTPLLLWREAQRFALARVLMQRANNLIFDEATSVQDADTEAHEPLLQINSTSLINFHQRKLPREYTNLCNLCPRSFLFAIVANVGPGGTTRTLVIAYHQGNDDISGEQTFVSRDDYFVSDTLALIETFRTPQSQTQSQFQGAGEPHVNQRPSVPDTPQPRFLVPEGYSWGKQTEPQLVLPWRACAEFPFTATCLILELLCDYSDGEDYGASVRPKLKRNNHRTRPGDVQLQSLATYGIAAFLISYMDDAEYHAYDCDPVEDPPPERSRMLCAPAEASCAVVYSAVVGGVLELSPLEE